MFLMMALFKEKKMGKKKSLLITSKNMNLGGIERGLVSFLKVLDYDKYDVTLVLMNSDGEFLDNIPKKTKVKFLSDEKWIFNNKNFNTLKKLFIWGILNFPFLCKFVLKSENKYDFAIAFNGYSDIMDLYVAFSNSSKKYIWVHSNFELRKKMDFLFKFKMFFVSYKYNHFDKIIAVSKDSALGFKKAFPKFAHKVSYIWNVVDFDKVIDGAKEKTNIKLNGKYNIVAMGRLLPVKGFERLVEVHKKLKEEGYDVKTYLIGGEAEIITSDLKNVFIKELVKTYELEDSFIFLGKMKNPFPILKQADVYVSTSYMEGFGLTLLEALALGIPVVAPNIGGLREVCLDIADRKMTILADNSIDGIYKAVVDVFKGEMLKGFKFDYNSYNKEVIKQINKLLN